MAGGTRPICAWCGNEGKYGYELRGYWGYIFQYLINGKQVFCHARCASNYKHSLEPYVNPQQ
jgi:hypothetical protein